MNVYNERLDELTFMLAHITGLSHQQSKQLILNTRIGKALQNKNQAIIYEQQTENIYQIAQELREQNNYPEIESLFTVDNIVNSFDALLESQADTGHIPGKLMFKISKTPELKSLQKKRYKLEQKQQLQFKQQNKFNLGRMT